MNDQVLEFIKKFKFIHAKELEDVFLYGNCYYFALILRHRFKYSKIMYDQSCGHFTTKIKGRLYDITGDVTAQYPESERFDTMDDLYKQRLINDCINFETR